MPTKKLEEVAEGIFLEPVPITLGDDIKIKYKGSLASSGAQKVFLHMGFGYGEWDQVQTIAMRKTRDGGWSTTLKAEDSSCLNFCFKDDADHWDNNAGKNWTYEIHNGDQAGY